MFTGRIVTIASPDFPAIPVSSRMPLTEVFGASTRAYFGTNPATTLQSLCRSSSTEALVLPGD